MWLLRSPVNHCSKLINGGGNRSFQLRAPQAHVSKAHHSPSSEHYPPPSDVASFPSQSLPLHQLPLSLRRQQPLLRLLRPQAPPFLPPSIRRRLVAPNPNAASLPWLFHFELN